jgi:hypothetical protein
MTRRQFFAAAVACLMGIAAAIRGPEPVKSTLTGWSIGCLNKGDIVTMSGSMVWFGPSTKFRVTGVYVSDGTAALELV